MERVIKEYYAQLHGNKLQNLDKMGNFVKIYLFIFERVSTRGREVQR